MDKSLYIGEREDGSIYEPIHRHFYLDHISGNTTLSTQGGNHLHYLNDDMDYTAITHDHIHRVPGRRFSSQE